MKALHFIALPVVCVCLGSFGLSQSHSSQTYASPDGAFEFKYLEPLILCKKGHQTDPQIWEPDDSCEAYIPACGDSAGSGGVVACAAYPHEKFAGTNLEAATFVVSEIREAKTERACLADLPQRDYPRPTKKTIHGVTFVAARRDGVAAGNSADTVSYRAFRGKSCYELDVRTSYSTAGMEDPSAVKTLAPAVRRDIGSKLDQALSSFRFLK